MISYIARKDGKQCCPAQPASARLGLAEGVI